MNLIRTFSVQLKEKTGNIPRDIPENDANYAHFFIFFFEASEYKHFFNNNFCTDFSIKGNIVGTNHCGTSVSV